MSIQDPRTPLRADHRFLHRLLQSVMGGKVEHVPEEYELISRVFQKAGGTWVGIFMGSPKDIALLKAVIKVALKKDRLTKKYKW